MPDPVPALARLTAERPEPARDGSPPARKDLAAILEAATTVPDHGSIRPWRFAVVTGAGRDRFGRVLVAGLVEQRGPDVPDAMVAKMRSKATVAPCSVMLISSPDISSNVVLWEQVASATCTGYAMVLAACALGYGAVWKSASVLDTGPVRDLFSAGEHERLLGWVNIGTPGERGTRSRHAKDEVDLASLVTVVHARSEPFAVEG